MRQLVGPTDPAAFDNPTGEPIFQSLMELPLDCYTSVFDFGCGCGRLARQLLQQRNRPRRYVGIDVHRGMIDWCNRNLSPLDPNFHFFHHDVYAPHAPENSLRLAEPFPAGDEEFSLVIAWSVFTHLLREQAEYYLFEVARILKPGGVAFTSWFFFDNESFPFLTHGPFCLFTSDANPTEAVIYDRQWFIDTIRRFGLAVRATVLPGLAGHQWCVFIERRNPPSVDQFPLGEQGAEWLCGATKKPIGKPLVPPDEVRKHQVAPCGRSESTTLGPSERPPVPKLQGWLAELAAIKQSPAWRIARLMIKPFRLIRKSILPR